MSDIYLGLPNRHIVQWMKKSNDRLVLTLTNGSKKKLEYNDSELTLSKIQAIDADVTVDTLMSIDYIPSNVISIIDFAFQDCIRLKTVNIPMHAPEIMSNAFIACNELTAIRFEGKTMSQIKTIRNYPWNLDKNTIIPDLIEVEVFSSDETKGSVEGSGTYKNGSVVTIKAIPKKDYKFERWSDRSTDEEKEILLTTDLSLTATFSIEDRLFLTLTDGTQKKIGYPNLYLNMLTIHNTDNSISEENLKSIDYIPLHITSIDIDSPSPTAQRWAFRDCIKLTSIILHENITKIGREAFLNCTALTSITIPGSVISIISSIFKNCSSLTSVVLSEGVKMLALMAFDNCSSLRYMSIPFSMTSISGSFSKFYALTEVRFEERTIQQIKSMSSYPWDLEENKIVPDLIELKLSSSDQDKGSVEGSGTYKNGSTTTIKAIPKDEYMFKCWSDGNTDEERVLTLTSDIELLATFYEVIPDNILTFTASDISSSITLNKTGNPDPVSLKYYDGSWHDYDIGTKIDIPNGSFVYMRAKDENATFSKNSSDIYRFSMTGKIAALGSIQYLLKKDGSRTDAPTHCYSNMFSGCTSLTAAPELPAIRLANGCYFYMFQDCSSLSAAPELSAISLADDCYCGMFLGCTSLSAAPELPAMSLADYCYYQMFQDCASLSVAPELSATTLTDNCYSLMFSGCTSLLAAPELSATTLARGCCQDMFRGCTSLSAAPELFATSLASYCYSGMFQGCTSLSVAPELPAESLASWCYDDMFLGCTKVADIYIPNLTEAEYNAEKVDKNSGELGREGQATFHFKES